jgi:hypothetical protein
MGVIAFPTPGPLNCAPGTHPAAPTTEGGLQLVRAFMKIENREQRAHLISLAERFSGQKP